MSPDEIIPYEFNNKKHSQDQINKIANSIKECWFRAPVLVDESNIILAWHGRVLGAKKLGLEKIPVIKYTDLTNTQKKKYRLLDNRLADLSEYDLDNVKIELMDIWDPDLFTLFNEFKLEFDQEELDIENQDVAPIPNDKPSVVKEGDIFQLWEHFLLCWDATKVENYQTLLSWKEADIIFTDPPYNINYRWSGKKTSNGIKNDHMDQNSFLCFLFDSFQSLSSVSRENAPWYVFHSHKTQKEFEQALNDNNIQVLYQLIWNKPSVNHVGGDYKQKHEPFFYACEKWYKPKFYWDIYDATVLDFHSEKTDEQLLKEIKKLREAEKNGKTSIWSMKRHNVQDYDHPTQKPVDLVAYALNNSSKIFDVVIDPFGWSGTTLIASEKTKRICYTMELDPKYAEVIIKRYSDFTRHKKPIKCLNRKLDIRKVLENI